ncbi:MAG: 23S rRNA (adenine(2503)-C(2))-methyltransferase RlmN [Rickettsiales bacterium]|nr:23S rRNA (adenine(2503)-C(2))-methyltransferase RlmN [Rickettsiales bacterium]
MLQPIEKTALVADDTAEKLSLKASLVGVSRALMKEQLMALGIEGFRANQIWQAMYAKGATDFTQMSTIKKDTQTLLAEHFSIARAGISRNAVSFDATQKWLLKFADGNEVETVFIPDANRGTLCVSSQVGCTLACTFCHTGTQRLVRNLTAGEIITQVLVAKDGLGEWASRLSDDPKGRLSDKKMNVQIHGATDHRINGSSGQPFIRSSPSRQLTNVVFMGMGEPLFNYDNLIASIDIMMSNEGLALSRRKITVSTSGVVPKIVPLAKDAGTNLAISLHAVTNDLRNEIVPINRKYPIEDLLEACREYQSIVNDRHIMFEYVMLAGVNDSEAEAKEMVRLLKGIRAKVNLIPFNPWPGAPYTCSSNNRIHAFGRVLIAAGIASPIRKTRGEDIMAACGQLKSMSELKKGQKVTGLNKRP